MDLKQAVRLIRKELLVKDEPLKAYNLLKALGLPALEKELKISRSNVEHLFDPKKYAEVYKDDDCLDYEKIEPVEYATQIGKKVPRYAWILQEIEREKAKSLVDLACYVGSLALTAAKKGYEATGVDLTVKAIEVAKKRNKQFKLNAKFFCDDLMNHKGKYDAVVAFEVIEHVPDPKKFVEHLASLTTKNGWCYITTPNGPFGDGAGNLPDWDGEGPRGHVRVFVVKTLVKLLKDYEFGVEPMGDGLLWAKFRRRKKKK